MFRRFVISTGREEVARMLIVRSCERTGAPLPEPRPEVVTLHILRTIETGPDHPRSMRPSATARERACTLVRAPSLR